MQTAQPTGRPHRNQGLFSDHYLNATLPTRPDWKALADEARPVMEEISSLLDTYTPCERVVESAEHVVGQPGGRFAFWGHQEGRNLYLRVVVTGDRSALHNAFFDTGFTRQQRRREHES